MVSAEAAEAMASFEEVDAESSHVASYEDVEFTPEDAKTIPPPSPSDIPFVFPTDPVKKSPFFLYLIGIFL